MAFKTRKDIETPEQEVARLAQAPADSSNHELSTMPVIVYGINRGMLIKLPPTHCKIGETVIVTPISRHSIEQPAGELRKRFHATWDCTVVGGDSQIYAPGCWDISMPEAALVRGKQVTITL